MLSKAEYSLLLTFVKAALQLIVFGFFSLISLAVSGQVFINEILAGNQNDIQDPFFQHEDWVEIYNPGGILNLAGYYFSDDPDSLDKWQVPATNAGLTTALPGDHIIFFFDNDPEQGENHGTFRLSTDGESVILTAPDGVTVIDSISFPHQQRDISYGRACDGCDSWIFFDITTPEASNEYVQPETQQVYINEVLAVNENGITDEIGDFEGWIEIFNPNPQQVNLAAYAIAHNDGTPHVIPSIDPPVTVAEEDDYRILWADAGVEEGANHLPFELSPEGGTLTLYGPDMAVVDTYSYPALQAGVSWGRIPDGNANSQEFSIPTPRMPNDLVIIQPELLFINEFIADNVSDTLDTALEYEDWIEIYNPNDYAVDLGGYWLTDNPQNPMKWQVPTNRPDSSVIPAGGYLLFFADEQQSEGWNHMNFRLNNAGEWIELRSPDGFTLADGLQYGQQYADTSFGRGFDGADYWVYFTETTPEYSNNGAEVNVAEEEKTTPMIWPNPVVSGQTLYLSEASEWRVFSMTGNLIGSGIGACISGISGWPPGAYILELNRKRRMRFVVTR